MSDKAAPNVGREGNVVTRMQGESACRGQDSILADRYSYGKRVIHRSENRSAKYRNKLEEKSVKSEMKENRK